MVSSGNLKKVVHVGRLHHEKLVEDLIKMMAELKRLNHSSAPIILNLIGDGPERDRLKELAIKEGVEEYVNFVGWIKSRNLPQYLLKADAYVSPNTGTALREAGLAGLPIIVYKMCWVSNIFKHNETVLFVPVRDFKNMAEKVISLMNDKKLKEQLSENVKEIAWKLWSPENYLQYSLKQAFQD